MPSPTPLIVKQTKMVLPPPLAPAPPPPSPHHQQLFPLLSGRLLLLLLSPKAWRLKEPPLQCARSPGASGKVGLRAVQFPTAAVSFVSLQPLPPSLTPLA